MKVLVLGGTSFLGRHVVEAAAHAGDTVTVLHRGRTTCPLPAGVGELLGDRTRDLAALLGDRSFDLVVDTSGQDSAAVDASVTHLRDRAAHYVFVSTVSVYADTSRPGLTEDDGSLHELPEGIYDDSGPELYGARKADAERVVRRAFGDRSLVVRPGLIVGRWDPTDRFTYWAERLLRGGRALAPGRPERPVQVVDARDLAQWCLRAGRDRIAGTYNAVGPASTITMADLLAALADVARGLGAPPSTLTWVDDAALLAAQVSPWIEIPLWVPEGGELEGFLRMSNDRALAAGLTFRPLAETARDVMQWVEELPDDRQRHAGLDPARERELLRGRSGVAR